MQWLCILAKMSWHASGDGVWGTVVLNASFLYLFFFCKWRWWFSAGSDHKKGFTCGCQMHKVILKMGKGTQMPSCKMLFLICSLKHLWSEHQLYCWQLCEKPAVLYADGCSGLAQRRFTRERPSLPSLLRRSEARCHLSGPGGTFRNWYWKPLLKWEVTLTV